jgi:hypothetical protein
MGVPLFSREHPTNQCNAWNYSGDTEKQLNLPLSHGQTHHAPNADSGTEGAVLILVALRRVVFAELQPWIQ